MDAWLMLKNIESDGERNRTFSIIKSRGMAHSNQLREFVLSEVGIQLLDVYKGSEGPYLRTARIAQESREIDERLRKKEEIERKKRELDVKRFLMENEITILKEKYAREEEEMNILLKQDITRKEKQRRSSLISRPEGRQINEPYTPLNGFDQGSRSRQYARNEQYKHGRFLCQPHQIQTI